jgi:hypothetical protein
MSHKDPNTKTGVEENNKKYPEKQINKHKNSSSKSDSGRVEALPGGV